MPFPPGPSSPRIVQTLRWLMRPLEFLDACRQRFGDVFSITFVGFETPMVMISDPEAIKAVYSNPANGLPPGRNLTLEPIVGARSILLLEGREHLERRKLMLPPFHGERMRSYEGIVEQAIATEIDSWPLDEEMPIHPRMQAVTLEVILRAVFGVTDPERLVRLREVLRSVLHDTASPRLQIAALVMRRLGRDGGGRWERFMETLTVANEELYGQIADRRADPELEKRDDILSALLCARFEDGEPMSDQEVRDQLMTLLLAGHETTATGLAWAFDLLLRHPAQLERLTQEIREGEGDEYLRATISEALRLRPVVPIAGRRLASELRVNGHVLEAGTDVSPAIWLTHTRPDIYPEPLAFRPERFLEDGPETYAWIPFGGGVRRCLGAAFAEFEMRIVLRDVLGRCDLEAASSKPERIGRRNITLSPKGGTPVLVTARREAPLPVAA